MADSGFQIAQRQAAGYDAQSGVFMAPSAALIVGRVGLAPGDVVLDIACGTGLVSRVIWPAVQPTGRVVGVDLNPAMLLVARSMAGEAEIEWVESSAQDLQFEDSTFTHVICQQGFQFFPDAGAATLEAHRVLRPGGLLAATVWATPRGNPYIETQLQLLADVRPDLATSATSATPPNADAILRSLAVAAGFENVAVSLLEHSVEVADLESFFLNQTATTPWAAALSTMTPGEKTRLASTFVDRLAAYSISGGGHRLPFASHLLVAQRAP